MAESSSSSKSDMGKPECQGKKLILDYNVFLRMKAGRKGVQLDEIFSKDHHCLFKATAKYTLVEAPLNTYLCPSCKDVLEAYVDKETGKNVYSFKFIENI